MSIHFWERERESASGGEEEKEGDAELKAGSRLWAASTESDAGLELMNGEIMTWAEVGRPTNWATQAPPNPPFMSSIILPGRPFLGTQPPVLAARDIPSSHALDEGVCLQKANGAKVEVTKGWWSI